MPGRRTENICFDRNHAIKIGDITFASGFLCSFRLFYDEYT